MQIRKAETQVVSDEGVYVIDTNGHDMLLWDMFADTMAIGRGWKGVHEDGGMTFDEVEQFDSNFDAMREWVE